VTVFLGKLQRSSHRDHVIFLHGVTHRHFPLIELGVFSREGNRQISRLPFFLALNYIG
jgi:hypothetical protein